MSIASLRQLWIFLGLAFALLGAAPALAQVEPAPPPIQLKEGPGDRPLILHATIEGRGGASASGNIQLTSVGRALPVLRVLASDLKCTEQPEAHIERSSVAAPATTSLTADQPQDLRITVSNILRPGTYTGTLRFYVPQQSEQVLSVPMEVRVQARPDVKATYPTLNRQSVRCGGWLSCAIAGMLLPGGVLRADWPVPLENHTLQAVAIEESTLTLRGDKSGEFLPAAALVPEKLAAPMRANQQLSLNLRVNPEKASADSYRGQLRLKIQGSDEPLLINLELGVREGPLLALIVIVLGIGMGRLVRQMETPEVQQQLKLMGRYHAALDRNAKLQDASAASYLQHQLDQIKERIENGRESEQALGTALEQIEARISFLLGLESLVERAAKMRGGERMVAEIAGDVAKARTALLQDKLAEAEELRKKILATLTMDGPMGERGRDGEESVESPAGARLAPLAPAAPAPSKLRRFFGQLLSLLSGLRASSADVRYWFIRPLLAVMLLMLLTLLGLQTLYVNAGSSFGAAGIYDYLGLFLWGLSADVAQRTLNSLPSVGSGAASRG